MIKKILSSKIFTVFTSLIVILAVLSIIGLDNKRNIVIDEIKGLEAKIADITSNNQHIEKFLAYFKSSAYLEKEARMKLNYKAPDEKVVFVLKDRNTNTVTTNSSGPLLNLSNYQKWWNYLLGK